MNCTNCHAALPENAKFCAECGCSIESAPAKIFCSNCGAALAPDELFCGNCGTKCGDDNAASSSAGTNYPPRPRWMFPLLGILAAAVLVAALIFLLPGKSDAQVVYLKDDQLQHLNLKKNAEPRELTKRLNEQNSGSTAVYGRTVFTEDGSKIFYPDRLEGNTYTLYCLDTTSRKSEPLKIDSGLSGYYELSSKGDRVAYIKDGKLYLHDLKEKTKIAGDVGNFYLSEDGKSVLYLTGDSGDFKLYLKKGSQEEVKIASGITELAHVSKDLSTVLFRKEDNLYICKNGKDPEKIASDVSSIWRVYDSGNCYFLKERDRVSYWSLLTDDVGGEDSDWVKANYADSYTESPVSELYYFDGKESTLVTEYARSLFDNHEQLEMLVISALPENELPQIRVSEYLESGESLSTLVSDAYNRAGKIYILEKGRLTELKLEDVHQLQLSHDGKKLMVATDYDQNTGSYTLKEVKLSGKGENASTKVDEDVVGFSYIGDTGNYIHLKATDGAQGATLYDLYHGNRFDLYVNGEKVCEEVTSYLSWSDNGKRIYYMCDYDPDDFSGTLYCFDGKKSTKIQSDVYAGDITEISPNRVLYLYDYSSKKGEGDLTIWRGKNTVKMDKDVTGIVTLYLP